ncbi:MAG: HAMP domain-containing sensor histidine kinase [Hyphomicrobiaceae bacterium]|nr:HAMP domain-containing sensor histidine kinase [Hyphomicrobiaceae bacterium]
MPRDIRADVVELPARALQRGLQRNWLRLRVLLRGRPQLRCAAPERRGPGLSAKLLLLTVLFVMLAEVLIFVPSVANFRVSWLRDRLTASHLAALAVEGVPGGAVPDGLRMELLQTAKVRAVAMKRDRERRLVLPSDGPLDIDDTYDFRASANGTGFLSDIRSRLRLIGEALAVFWTRNDRIIRVIGETARGGGDFIEVVLPERPLKQAMIRYGLNVLGLSVIISIITAALVYFSLNSLFVQPMMRMTRNILRFSERPEDTSRIMIPSERSDEIGTAERELAHMQLQLTQTLQQKSRLAALGLAVSKVSHDLRNMLSSAQLISDRLSSVPDPTVQRFAPKLIASLDRAISFCESTLRFGRAEEANPRRELFPLRRLVEEIGDGLGLPREGSIGWQVAVDEALRIDADRDQLFRCLSNLARNAVQAIEQLERDGGGNVEIAARREGARVVIHVKDDGPGLSAQARAHIFQAFQGSSGRKGGTGLGLAIAHELISAHGGSIRLLEADKGAQFEIDIPDRVV